MPSQVAMYRRKLSGPLMDRIDLFIEVPALKYEKLVSADVENSSSKIQERVGKARKIQEERFNPSILFARSGQAPSTSSSHRTLTNSEMNIPQIGKFCQVDSKSQDLLRKYVNSGKLSARGYHRVLKVARTIADLEESENILYDHLAEALMYRVREEN